MSLYVQVHIGAFASTIMYIKKTRGQAARLVEVRGKWAMTELRSF